MSKKKQILRAAADLIEKTGWCQGEYTQGPLTKPIAYCLVGACNWVDVPNMEEDDVIDAINVMEDRCDGDAVAWNDAPGRTKDEVIAELRLAAKGIR